MKKNTILVALLLLLMVLFSCERNKTNNNTTPQNEVVTVEEPQQETPDIAEAVLPEAAEDQCIAFEVFQKIPKEDVDEEYRDVDFPCPENSTVVLEVGDYENSFEVRCFPYKQGGWLVYYNKEYCYDGCEQYIQLYQYNDGLLTPIEDDVLPHMDESDYIALLREVLIAEEIDESEWEGYDIDYLSNGYIQEYFSFYDNTKLEVFIDYLDWEGVWEAKVPEKYYVWNGKNFERRYVR